jgi:hypothetical protein
MTLDIETLKQLILGLGSISGLLTLPYVVIQAAKKRPRLKFDFSGMSGNGLKKNDAIGDYYSFQFMGTIKNRSLIPNSISKIYLIVWADNEKRNSALRLGFGGILSDTNGKKLPLPLELSSMNGKKVQVNFEIPVKGTSDERLLSEVIPVGNSGQFYLPKHKYELCFEDTDENFFDQQGRLRNLEEINLRWTLSNTMKDLQGGNFIPFLKHTFSIQKSVILFFLKKIKNRLGL